MHVVSPMPKVMLVCQSSRAGRFIEATTTQDVVLTYDEHEYTLPKGSVVDAPCTTEVDSADDLVIIRSGMAEWTCPTCGESNIVEFP